MNNQAITTALKQMNIIYIALIVGQIIFAAVAYTVASEETTSLTFPAYLVPVVSLFTISTSYLIYNMLKQKGQNLKGLSFKVGHYRMASIVRWALVEGGNLFALVAYLMTGQLHLLLFFALGMVIFYFYRPSTERFVYDYKLTGQEREVIEKG